MNIVLYTDDMEAVTVIDVPRIFAKAEPPFKNSFVVAVHEPFRGIASNEPLELRLMRTVTIRIEWFQRKGQYHPFFFINNEEWALELRSSRLPGQHKEYHREFERGFINGIMAAMRE